LSVSDRVQKKLVPVHKTFEANPQKVARFLGNCRPALSIQLMIPQLLSFDQWAAFKYITFSEQRWHNKTFESLKKSISSRVPQKVDTTSEKLSAPPTIHAAICWQPQPFAPIPSALPFPIVFIPLSPILAAFPSAGEMMWKVLETTIITHDPDQDQWCGERDGIKARMAGNFT
jgi:hypothetical protein